MKKFIFTESQLKNVLNSVISEEQISPHKKWWYSLQPDEQQNYMEKYFPDNSFGALATSNNEIKIMFDKEHETNNEFRPNVNMGKFFNKFKKSNN